MSCSGCIKQAAHMAHGAVALAKSKLGIGYAAQDVIERRRVICRQCERAVPCPFNQHRFCWCAECGCQLVDKTRLADEECPIGSWPAITIAEAAGERSTATPPPS